MTEEHKRGSDDEEKCEQPYDSEVYQDLEIRAMGDSGHVDDILDVGKIPRMRRIRGFDNREIRRADSENGVISGHVESDPPEVRSAGAAASGEIAHARA